MRRWSFVAGAGLVTLGVFALIQTGLDVLGVPFRIWWIFWPLVLIGAGIWVIQGFTRRGSWDVQREEASIPLDGASEAALTFHHGAGRLSVKGGAAADQLVSGSFGGGLDSTRRTESGRLAVDMRVRDRDAAHFIFAPWRGGWAGALDWDVALNQTVPLTLRLETGASETRLFLRDTQLRELRLKTGASSTSIELPAAAGFTRVFVESGAASVRIRVPQGVAASIDVKSAMAGIHVDAARFPRSGARNESPDYASAMNKVEILVETGVGSVDIG
jgi:hypothetical protein